MPLEATESEVSEVLKNLEATKRSSAASASSAVSAEPLATCVRRQESIWNSDLRILRQWEWKCRALGRSRELTRVRTCPVGFQNPSSESETGTSGPSQRVKKCKSGLGRRLEYPPRPRVLERPHREQPGFQKTL